VPPQYTDHADQVIEKGTSLRLKILGVKPDVAAINAIGTIKEDYLGWVCFAVCVIASANTHYFLFLDHSKYTKLAALYDNYDHRTITEGRTLGSLFYAQLPNLSRRESQP
jgi:hypothetical protein